MNMTIAGPLESRKAWEDTVSWVQVTVTEVNGEGAVIEREGEVTRLLFPASVDLVASGPVDAAYSEARNLLALGCATGPVVPIGRGFGVFGLLPGHDRYVFLRVFPGAHPHPDTICRSCRYPAGVSTDLECRHHRGMGAMSRMGRANTFGTAEIAADAAAFSGPAGRLADAIETVAGRAFPLEAYRLLEKYLPTVDRFESVEHRFEVVGALRALALATEDESLVTRIDAMLVGLGAHAVSQRKAHSTLLMCHPRVSGEEV